MSNTTAVGQPAVQGDGDQLREDLRGVGKAASGALVERQIEGLADRLHGRTAEVRDQLAGVVPDVPGLGDEEEENGSSLTRGQDRGDGHRLVGGRPRAVVAREPLTTQV